MYDAIIVGARCAGAPVALLLARLGYRVLLLDKSTFPSDIMSTHYIHPPGVARMKRWGVLDKVLATNCPPIDGFRFDIGPVAIEGMPPSFEGIGYGLCPRRIALDKILVDAAMEEGAELRENFYVLGLTADDGRVTGVRGRSGSGETVDHARIVIGADGQHSIVARAVKAPEYRVVEAQGCAYYSYFSGVADTSTELYPRLGRETLLFPTNDGMACIAVYRPHADFARYRADVEGIFFGDIRETVPSLYERLADRRREEEFIGTADTRNFFRKPFGPGWALVGDAGYHKDPITGLGITDAFRDAELLVSAIHDGFSGRRPLEEALAGYEETRNRVAGPLYDMTIQQTRLESPEPMVAMFEAMNRDPDLKNSFFSSISGAAPGTELLAPDFLKAISRG
ncbi:MAG TPA: NAD(P)/FAD-dependent oxidoreductase [Candidatus Binataceae bacterium]